MIPLKSLQLFADVSASKGHSKSKKVQFSLFKAQSTLD